MNLEATETGPINFFGAFDLTSNGSTRCALDTKKPLVLSYSKHGTVSPIGEN